MDLTAANFANYLPWVLHELSSCCFVALDLEMSGIALSVRNQGFKTLQKHYENNKAAAEKYQVLQVGLTVCHEDKKNASYVLRPYNVDLNPILDRNLDVNRDCTFMGWSMEFLIGNKFDVSAIFRQGVRYLSREEEIEARDQAARRWAPRDPLEDAQLSNEETVGFLQAVRREIDNWIARGATRSAYLNIPPQTTSQRKPHQTLPSQLNNMQKWLVHHLVETEYPNIKSRGMPTFVQVEQHNRENMAFDERMKESNLRIRKHVGFRWIAEALAGGDLSDLEPTTFKALMPNIENPSFTVKELSDRLKKRLLENQPILIGHNSFTDMVFFYSCFLGPLPDTVEEFTFLIHQTFPMLIDTKYLATHDCDAMNAASSLEELNKTLAKISSPKIDVDSIHSKYLYRRSAHEAGYDSMLTAIAFIKLSVQLQRGKFPKGKRGRLEDMVIGLANNPLPTSAVLELFPSSVPSASEHRFRDFFDTEDEEGEAEEKPPMPAAPPGAVSPIPLANTGSEEVDTMVRHGLLIPRLDSEFWRVYGNRLRVFGTKEKVVYFGEDGGANERIEMQHWLGQD
ncbi:uncharacterized protein N7482_006595 [Penicillium canariense]|uniref:Uncharacterized protein n=1 Tax=Penicillium canariense TaxID=189055 RepID=A0A9W9HXW0_9EURO|nr:uncharacterized protein N7482_006595 [Penicillium canariense]KAJ5159591.1 hypothetical protein N7482_006595 [Penicillium canariense]